MQWRLQPGIEGRNGVPDPISGGGLGLVLFVEVTQIKLFIATKMAGFMDDFLVSGGRRANFSFYEGSHRKQTRSSKYKFLVTNQIEIIIKFKFLVTNQIEIQIAHC